VYDSGLCLFKDEVERLINKASDHIGSVYNDLIVSAIEELVEMKDQCTKSMDCGTAKAFSARIVVAQAQWSSVVTRSTEFEKSVVSPALGFLEQAQCILVKCDHLKDPASFMSGVLETTLARFDAFSGGHHDHVDRAGAPGCFGDLHFLEQCRHGTRVGTGRCAAG
jgi:hypothetical protein